MSLRLEGITKRFSKKVILENFSYEFEETGVYVIKADSGVGKTTLLRIISGLDKDYSGTVHGGGAKNVSYAFQEYRLFPSLTALQNVLVARNEESAESVEAAKSILLSLGLTEEELSLKPCELSGGMKQRVSLSRALFKDSPVLLLDEPTKELDNRLREKVCSLVETESERRLVILVTHGDEDTLLENATLIEL